MQLDPRVLGAHLFHTAIVGAVVHQHDLQAILGIVELLQALEAGLQMMPAIQVQDHNRDTRQLCYGNGAAGAHNQVLRRLKTQCILSSGGNRGLRA